MCSFALWMRKKYAAKIKMKGTRVNLLRSKRSKTLVMISFGVIRFILLLDYGCVILCLLHTEAEEAVKRRRCHCVKVGFAFLNDVYRTFRERYGMVDIMTYENVYSFSFVRI